MTQATVQHTPGPWAVVEVPGVGARIVDPSDFTVAQIPWPLGDPFGTADGDAALIAAAPAMLAALERARDYMQHPKSGSIPAGASLVAVLGAIAQARGEG